MNRLLVLANVLIGASMAGLVLLGIDLATKTVLISLAVLMFLLGLTLEYRTRALANSMDHQVDERQRARRDHAHRIAYWTLSFPVGFAGGMIVARLHRTWDEGIGLSISPDGLPAFLVFFWLGLILFLTLPTAIIAWTEPTPLDDDLA
ncbi:MAG: hypothetical protein AAGH65_04300 [Pseudomonadota bacterium]